MTRDETMDEAFMGRALELASGPRSTTPNPRVGAVVVSDDEVVAEGAHQGAGTPHAEAIALAGRTDLGGSTIYVNLEPCNHTGRMPPCAPAIVEAGIARVVVGIEDPDERVGGRGIAFLRDHGVQVDTGVLAAECTQINRPYLVHRTVGRSFVTLKLALSIDGRLAAPDGSARWITGEATRLAVHGDRAGADAVLVGAGTVEADDPELTARHVDPPARPLRVVVDTAGRIDPAARVFGPGETIIATTDRCSFDRQTAYKEAGADVWVMDESADGVDLGALLRGLGERDVLEVYCEGGAALATSLLRADLVDRLVIHTGPLVLGRGGPEIGDVGIASMHDASRWRLVDVARSDDDVLATYERAEA